MFYFQCNLFQCQYERFNVDVFFVVQVLFLTSKFTVTLLTPYSPAFPVKSVLASLSVLF